MPDIALSAAGALMPVFMQAVVPTGRCGRRGLDLVGARYGRLLVQDVAVGDNRKQGRRWDCLCDCGRMVTVRAKDLKDKRSNTRSCGCLAQRWVTTRDALTDRQATMLRSLARHAGGLRPGLFVQVLGCSATYVSRIVRRLVARGMVRKAGGLLRVEAPGLAALRLHAARAAQAPRGASAPS